MGCQPSVVINAARRAPSWLAMAGLPLYLRLCTASRKMPRWGDVEAMLLKGITSRCTMSSGRLASSAAQRAHHSVSTRPQCSQHGG